MGDIAASTLAQLQNKAKETGRSYQLCLQLFCQEEFMRRLSVSKHIEKLVLKGGLFIYTLTEFDSRVTMDIDFLLNKISNDEAEILQIVKDIIKTETANNFLTFEIKNVSPISMQQKYNGWRVAIVGMIKNTRTPINIDFGVGDVIVPKPEKRKIKTQLEGFVSPEIYTYSLESVLAEKFDAIITRLELTSRMKDFYDIYYIAHSFDFEGEKLQDAIFETLHNRKTSYDDETFERIENLSEIEVMRIRWKAFLKKIKTPELELKVVLDTIKIFIKPVFEAILEERNFSNQWNSDKQKWKAEKN